MLIRVHILSKKLTYIKLKIVLCSLQDIHEFLDLSPQPPTLVSTKSISEPVFRTSTFHFEFYCRISSLSFPPNCTYV